MKIKWTKWGTIGAWVGIVLMLLFWLFPREQKMTIGIESATEQVYSTHMAEQNNELKMFIEETLRQIVEGKGKHDLYGSEVQFEIAIGKTTTTEGKVSVGVLSVIKAGTEGRGEHKSENVSKINFKILLNTDENRSHHAPELAGNQY